MKQEFWVTNISPRNVTLADLATNIPAYSIVNLLDSKHYSLTLEQLQKSQISGSLFNKRNRIVVRKDAPPIEKKNIPININSAIPSRQRSLFVINKTEYDELKVADNEEIERILEEELAREHAELDDPTEPIIKKDK